MFKFIPIVYAVHCFYVVHNLIVLFSETAKTKRSLTCLNYYDSVLRSPVSTRLLFYAMLCSVLVSRAFNKTK